MGEESDYEDRDRDSGRLNRRSLPKKTIVCYLPTQNCPYPLSSKQPPQLVLPIREPHHICDWHPGRPATS